MLGWCRVICCFGFYTKERSEMDAKFCPMPLHRYIIVEELQDDDPKEESSEGFDFSGFEELDEIDYNHHEVVRIIKVGPKVEHVSLKSGDLVVIGDTHLTKKITLPDNREVLVITENQLVLELYQTED